MTFIALLLAIYFIVWWLVFFAVLPWGVRSQHEAGESARGSDPGAPVAHRLLLKMFVTTLVSAVLLAVGYAVWRSGWISIDSFPMPYERIKF